MNQLKIERQQFGLVTVVSQLKNKNVNCTLSLLARNNKRAEYIKIHKHIELT